MKRRNGIIIASVAHLILWIAVLPICIVGRLTFQGYPGMDKFDLLFYKGLYTFSIIIAVAGIFNSALLFSSLSFVLSPAITKGKVLEKVALAFSIASNIFFYLFAVLVFLINSDSIFIVPTLWILCAACSFILLIVLGIKRVVTWGCGTET